MYVLLARLFGFNAFKAVTFRLVVAELAVAVFILAEFGRSLQVLFDDLVDFGVGSIVDDDRRVAELDRRGQP